MPNKRSLDRKLGDQLFDHGFGPCPPSLPRTVIGAALLHVPAPWTPRGLRCRRRRDLMPEQRQRQLTLPGNARQSRAQCRRAFVERFQRGIRWRERRAEADRKTALGGADALDQLVMSECVGAFAEAVRRPRTREPDAVALRLAGRAEPPDDVAKLDFALATHEHAESGNRGRRRIVDQGFAVHAFGGRLDDCQGLFRQRGIAQAPVFADRLLAALAQQKRLARGSRGDLVVQRTDGGAERRPRSFTLDRDDPFRASLDGAEPFPKLVGACPKELADTLRVTVDRAEGERDDRARELEELAVHLLMGCRSRREPLQVLKSRVEGFLFVFGGGHGARDAEKMTLDDRFDPAPADAAKIRSCDRRLCPRVRDRVEVAQLAGHSSSSGTSMTTERFSPSAGAEASPTSRASKRRCSRISRSRVRSTASRSVYSSSVTPPSSSSIWSSRSCSRTGASSVNCCSA